MAETFYRIPLCRCCHKNGVFNSLFSAFIYENEIENYSQMLCDTFGILFAASECEKIYTICDECIEKLRISTKFKNCVLACEKNIKREASIETDVTLKIEKMWSYKSNEKEGPLIAEDNKVTKEETSNCEDHDTDINSVLDEESNEEVISEKSGNESLCESESSLSNTSDTQESKYKTFKRKGDFENHIRTHYGYKCQICPEILSNQREHSRHIESKHFVDGKYCCVACDATFLEVKKLIYHIKTHFKHRCNICNRYFKRKTDLRSHEVVHSDEKAFKCSICNKLFKRHQALKVHMETHTGGTPYECQECSQKFTFKNNLLRHHQNVHMGVKKYSCRYCDKRYTTKQNLVVHERTHTGVKPYVCEKCDKPFSSKEFLLIHNKVHLAHKPYICKVCDKAFKTKGTFRIHMLTHTGIKSFQCGVCSKTFLLKYYLNRHMKVHNSERL